MEQQTVPNTYDYHQYDQIWQRVSPSLNPYPGGYPANQRAVPAMAEMPQTLQQAAQGMPALQNNQMFQNAQTALQNGQTALQSSQTALQNGQMALQNGQTALQNGQTVQMVQPSQGMALPAMDTGPCCMGPAAEEMLDILHGFIEGELADRRYYAAFARQAPSWARQTLRDISAEEAAHARRLMAVHYLITGSCYQPAIGDERIYVGALCAALRTRYHEEVCGAMNYARAADGTTDPCLERLLRELSEEEYSHADRLLAMLERGMG